EQTIAFRRGVGLIRYASQEKRTWPLELARTHGSADSRLGGGVREGKYGHGKRRRARDFLLERSSQRQPSRGCRSLSRRHSSGAERSGFAEQPNPDRSRARQT